MKKLSCDLILERDTIGVLLHTASSGERCRRLLMRASPGEWPFHSFTATTDMRDFIANVVAYGNGSCSVKGVYRGKMTQLRNVHPCTPVKVGERVMVTEHVGIDGRFGFIATKGRILVGDLNFVNVGWSDERGSRQLSVDIYTGEARESKGGPVPPSIRMGR